MSPETLTCVGLPGIGEVHEGDDLAGLVAASAALRDGDVLVVTSKVVSKAEGRVARTTRSEALARETDRRVATRGDTAIVRTHLGLVMAAAGIDGSNTPPGTVVLLPRDPDRSARALRERLASLTGHNVAVVVSDTSGRAWRVGQTDIAIGVAGLEPVDDYGGMSDDFGNPLVVTAPAVADEVAAAADLVKGKLTRTPAAVVRGLEGLVLPRGTHGSGARALVRDETLDLFGYGAREAVARAVRAAPPDLRGFGAAATAEELVEVLGQVAGAAAEIGQGPDGEVEVRIVLEDDRQLGRLEARLAVLAFSLGWVERPRRADEPVLGFAPGTP